LGDAVSDELDDGEFEVGHRRPPVGGAALEGQAVWMVCSSSWVVATRLARSPPKFRCGVSGSH
jgi:hypothetical protein